MARTIGRKNVNIVKSITLDEIKKATSPYTGTNYSGIEEKVIDRINSEIFDIWEAAYSEIVRIISDTCTEHSHKTPWRR